MFWHRPLTQMSSKVHSSMSERDRGDTAVRDKSTSDSWRTNGSRGEEEETGDRQRTVGTVGGQETAGPTLAGLPVRRADEAHVTLAAEASRQVQAVSVVTQVSVLGALVAVCGDTETNLGHTQSVHSSLKSRRRQRDLSSRSRLRRSRPCRRSGMSPWCSHSRRCCCTCESRWSTRPGLRDKRSTDTQFVLFRRLSEEVPACVCLPEHLMPLPIQPGAQ